MTLRYGTWRRSMTFGTVLLGLSFAGRIYFREESWAFLIPIFGWTVMVVYGVFLGVVGLLRVTGRLEFTYTEADRLSYFYNMEKLHRQMIESRRARKRE